MGRGSRPQVDLLAYFRIIFSPKFKPQEGGLCWRSQEKRSLTL